MKIWCFYPDLVKIFEFISEKSWTMWPALMVAARTYAPFVVFPFAFIIGAIGYSIEGISTLFIPEKPFDFVLFCFIISLSIFQFSVQKWKLISKPFSNPYLGSLNRNEIPSFLNYYHPLNSFPFFFTNSLHKMGKLFDFFKLCYSLINMRQLQILFN